MDELSSALRQLASALENERADSESDEGMISEATEIDHRFDAVEKAVDDVLWYHRLDGVDVRKITCTGPPPANTTAQYVQGEGNRVTVPAYVFEPGDAGDEARPLLVFPHGGVHSNFSTRVANVVQELVDQGYVVVAPEYRGSTGYGREHYELVDYGGLEIEDTRAVRDWAVEALPTVDEERVGVLGWSHGGLHTLMNAFEYPERYAVAYAGVPVSDLVARMGYKSQSYRDLYSAEYHVGETAFENPDAYRERSPAWHAEKLEIPLRVHTTRNDEDVNVLEVETLVRALESEGKEFEYEIYDDAPGGHAFETLDTPFARERRREIWEFLARHLDPPNPVTGTDA
jgi:dipeptidyl aminopeptidase/acylaminoacyl peptidase